MAQLLPTAEERGKLRFEFWKWVGLSLLTAGGAGAAVFVPAVRAWLLRHFDVIAAESVRNVVISRATLWALWICTAFFVAYVVIQLITLFGPKTIRQFRQGEYDGIIWRWRWKGRDVLVTSMKPFCAKCGTELDLIIRGEEWVRVGAITQIRQDTHAYCTTCNKADVIVVNCDTLPDHIRRKIEADARNGTWKTAIERIPPMFRI